MITAPIVHNSNPWWNNVDFAGTERGFPEMSFKGPPLRFEKNFVQSLQKKRQKARKRVRFADFHKVHSYAAPTKEELGKCWYQKQEIDDIKTEIKDTVSTYHRMGHKASKLPRSRCLRGLEPLLSPAGTKFSRQKRREKVLAVLRAQHDTFNFTGRVDPIMLKMISRMNSKLQVKDAIRIASEDARIWHEEYADSAQTM